MMRGMRNLDLNRLEAESMKKDMEINVRDRCHHCDFWSGDDEQGFRIVSKERYDWLVKAAEQNYEMQGDDDWVDWVDEGKKLTKKGE